MSKTAVFTIVSKNYLSFARVLMDSLAVHSPAMDRYVLLADRVDGYFDPRLEDFRTVEIQDISLPAEHELLFKYNIMELNTAVKPFFIDHLFGNLGYSKVIYFDPDILITGDLDRLSGLLDNHSVVLTPHVTSPLPDDGKRHSEIDIMRAGCYNLGFAGFAHYEKIGFFIDWWKDRLGKYCYSAPDKGLFVDQKWMDLSPCYIDDVHILRHPGYNAAYWNLHERRIEERDGIFSVNGQELSFYHFSGISFDNLEAVSKYQDRFTLSDVPALCSLFGRYRDIVFAHGFESTRRWPYAYGFFDNGLLIPDIVRRLYAAIAEQGRFGNPFDTSAKDCFFAWLTSPAEGLRIPNILAYLYDARPDLRAAFPCLSDAQEQLFQWARAELPRQYSFTEDFMSCLRLAPDKLNGRSSPPRLERSRLPADFLWEFGLQHAAAIKQVPLLRTLAEKAFWRLAAGRTTASLPALPAFSPSAVGSSADSAPADRAAGINVSGYLDTESGVGEAARGMIRSISRSRLPFVLNNIEQQWLRRNDATYTDFASDNPCGINLVHVNADQVPNVFRQLGEGYFHGKYNIGYWFWELSEFPKRWHGSFKYFDEIWVASDFLLDAVSRVSPIPVVKVGISVEFTSPGLLARKTLGISDDTYVFLNIFDGRSFTERKNPLGLIEAFRIAYHDMGCRDSVLVLKIANADANPQLMETLRKKAAGLPVVFIDQYYDRQQVYDLLSLCDCYVSLHHAEGLGLPMAESMYLGKPVIATGYSGNMEFMNINNSFPVKFKLLELEETVGPYEAGSVWADPDVGHAAQLMASASGRGDDVDQVSATGAKDVRILLGADSLSRKITQRLRLISQHWK